MARVIFFSSSKDSCGGEFNGRVHHDVDDWVRKDSTAQAPTIKNTAIQKFILVRFSFDGTWCQEGWIISWMKEILLEIKVFQSRNLIQSILNLNMLNKGFY